MTAVGKDGGHCFYAVNEYICNMICTCDFLPNDLPDGPQKIVVERLGSTNTALAEMLGRGELPHGTALCARNQTAGRGQRGNVWESEPYKNVALSILLRPRGLKASAQFIVSQAVSLAVIDTLRMLCGHGTQEFSVKWPNDIYAGDRKICGILIECGLSGEYVEYVIAGIGVNVNQRLFVSDAPNPVSLCQLTDREYPVEAAEDMLIASVLRRMEAVASQPEWEGLRREYASLLWHREGWHPYRDNLRGEEFEGRLVGVSPSGILSLEDRDGQLRAFSFKEVTAIL